MNWFRSHYIRIRNILIGMIMVGTVVFIWYGVGKYRDRRAEESVPAVRSDLTAVSAIPSDEERGSEQTDLLPGQNAEGEILTEERQTEMGETEAAVGMADDVEELTVSEQLYLSGLAQKEALKHNEDGTVTWQGRTYRRNSYMKAILCLGIDRSDTMTGTREFGDVGQADGIFLIAQDTARNQIQILMIPRDTMTVMNETDEEGNDLGIWLDHLTLAFGFGDGSTGSCVRMTEAVSEVLCGLAVDHYLAVDTAVIAELNDAVGGVTVTIPTEGMEKRNPAFVKGNQVTLHGSEAEDFIRYRDIGTDNSAVYRMDQHKEYIQQYFKTLQEKAGKDNGLIARLFDQIQDYMITDMDKAEYLKIAIDSLNGGSLDDNSFYVLPGIGITTDIFDEYHVTYSQAIPVILKLFYRETAP